ncbi:MAG TPA: L,D-transpeptidase family protein [Anaerolineales bacterium]|nr:L,D-transpeptidase family protein [Anaerolineales bacterium]
MNTLLSNGRIRLVPVLLLILLCVGAGIILFFFAASPASASIGYIFGPSPTATQENLWAQVELPKPTYTAVPPILPTDTAQPTATETPGTVAMEIIEDTPVPTRPAVVEQAVDPAIPSYGGSKYILVDISEQHMYVYEGDALIYSFVASTGMNNATRVGTFAVQSKIPNAYGATWNIWMPSWLGIYWSGGLENGIHALPILPNGATLWEGFLGRPVSYGCVVLGTYEAQVLYDWAEMGTPVEIQW